MHSTNNIPSAVESGPDELHLDGSLPLLAALLPLQRRSALGQGGNGGAVAFSATARAQQPAVGEVRNER